jgi:methylamine utilization protein MauE
VAMFATTIALMGAAILLWAGLEKARDPGSTVSTLLQLGVPARLARAAGLLIVAELAVGLGLVFRPDSAWTQVGVVVLAGAFAGAGLLALRRGERIRCACFGSGRRGYLGANQIKALVPWVGGAAILRVGDVERPSPSRGAELLAGIALTMAGLRLVPLVGAWREARGDRRSAIETYVWARR